VLVRRRRGERGEGRGEGRGERGEGEGRGESEEGRGKRGEWRGERGEGRVRGGEAGKFLSPSPGLGNWMVDEVLYQSSLHPCTYTSTLEEAESAEILKNIYHVVKTAVKARKTGRTFPEDWLFHNRWSKAQKKSLFPPFHFSISSTPLILPRSSLKPSSVLPRSFLSLKPPKPSLPV
jgi:hypothetical protein